MSKKQCILYIDDKAEMISLTRILLRQRGFKMLGALGGAQGLETIRREKPDLVLLDLVMPGMSGWEVYEQMQADQDLADIPVIIITASVQTTDQATKLQQATRVVDYITKPFAPRALVASIDRALTDRNKKYGQCILD